MIVWLHAGYPFVAGLSGLIASGMGRAAAGYAPDGHIPAPLPAIALDGEQGIAGAGRFETAEAA